MEEAVNNNAAGDNNQAVPGLLPAALGQLQAALGLLNAGWSQRLTVILFGLQLAMLVLNLVHLGVLAIHVANVSLGSAIFVLAFVKVGLCGGLARNLSDSQHHVSYTLLVACTVQLLLVILDLSLHLTEVKHHLHYCHIGFALSLLNMIMLLYPILRPECLRDPQA